jgi:hypothetical protein
MSGGFYYNGSPIMQEQWNLHYEGWMIADSVPDRYVGEVFEWFALAFSSESRLSTSQGRLKSAIPVGDYADRIVAEVTYLSDKACIIDFGLRAASSSDEIPSGCQPGDYVTGEIYLDLPLCIDVEESLSHTWRVNGISADLTACVPHPEYTGGFIRDASNVRYQEITDTDSVRAHNYILHCSEVKAE